MGAVAVVVSIASLFIAVASALYTKKQAAAAERQAMAGERQALAAEEANANAKEAIGIALVGHPTGGQPLLVAEVVAVQEAANEGPTVELEVANPGEASVELRRLNLSAPCVRSGGSEQTVGQWEYDDGPLILEPGSSLNVSARFKFDRPKSGPTNAPTAWYEAVSLQGATYKRPLALGDRDGNLRSVILARQSEDSRARITTEQIIRNSRWGGIF
jgi:hypothetical protein